MRIRIFTFILFLLVSAIALADFKSAAKPITHKVSIHDMKFDPSGVDAAIGDAVTWTNDDDRDHTVVAKDGSFKSKNLSSGDSFSVTFKKAGKISYGCSLHPRMKGTVNVGAD